MLVKNAAESAAGDAGDVTACQCLIKEDCITVLRTVGLGEFGVVQHGVWTKDTGQESVAVKCISKVKLATEPADFLRQISLLSTIDHPHVVQLFGVTSTVDSFMLVEYSSRFCPFILPSYLVWCHTVIQLGPRHYLSRPRHNPSD